ncbi:MAG TPA: hypothetical protein DCG30_02305, partial [Ruminococcus sp.]|nr:hypothetical protein [Ruminococcus sp.]
MNTKKKTFGKRFLGVMIAFFMVFTSVPMKEIVVPDMDSVAETQANPWNPWGGFGGFGGFGMWGPMVLPNASVSFTDSKFKSIDSVNSGEMFYLSVQLSGANVNNPFGSDTFQLEITDSNLLLPNFAGNGLVDGATYNGFTLHTRADGSRYLEYSIRNGDTKMIRLQAKFANGTTPDGLQETVKLVQKTSGKSVSSTITAKSNCEWTSGKSEDKTVISSDDFAGNGKVNYTLSASSSTGSASKAAWWAESLTFNDTISLTNLTFTDNAASSIKSSVESAIKAKGYQLDGDVTVNVSGNSASVSFTLKNQSETTVLGQKSLSKEMDNVSLTIQLPVNTSSMSGTDEGTVTNSLSVEVKPLNGDSKSAGENAVELSVEKPPVPNPASFSVSKYADKNLIYIEEENEQVTFTITVTNSGDLAGTVNVEDILPEGMEFVSATDSDEKTYTSLDNITFENMAKGSKTITVVCNITKKEEGTLTNEVKITSDSEITTPQAEASVSLKEKKADLHYNKSGNVDGANVFYKGEAGNVTYNIHIDNSNGMADGTFSFTDDVPESLKNVAIDSVNSSKGNDYTSYITRNGNNISGDGIILAGDSITVTVTAELDSETSAELDEITNILYSGEEKVGEVTFTGETPTAGLWGRKFASTYQYNYHEAGQPVDFTIELFNTGKKAANGVVINDDALEGLALDVNSITAYVTDKDTNVADVSDSEKIEGDSFPITVGTLAAGKKVVVIIKTETTADAGDNITNTFGYTSTDGGDNENAGSVTVNVDKSGMYKVDKWIVDDEGNTLVDTDGNITKGFEGFAEGDEITYQFSFENNSEEALENIYFNDYAERQGMIDDYVEVVQSDSVSYPVGTLIKYNKEFSDAGAYYNPLAQVDGEYWDKVGYVVPQDNNFNSYPILKYALIGANLPIGGKITFQYRLKYTEVDQWNRAKNKVGVSLDENSWNTGTYVDDVTVPINSSFSVSKSASPETVDINQSDFADVKENGINYTINLIPNSADSNSYWGCKFTVKDKLPDGVTYEENSVQGSQNLADITAEYDESTNELTITFTCNSNLNGWNPSEYIKYTGLISDKLASQLENIAPKESDTVVNTVNEVIVEGNVNKTVSTPKTAKTTFTNVAPAPGFSKEAIASLPGAWDINSADFSRVSNGLITAGDNLIWDLVVYNGNGDTNKFNTTDTAVYKIGGKKITDILPGVYKFGAVIGAGKVSIKSDGTYLTAGETQGEYQDLYTGDESLSGSASATESGKNVEFVIPDGVELNPNEAYVIRFYTSIIDGLEKEGVITNTGYLTDDKEYSQNQVVAGEPKGKKIWNSANYNIAGLTTESWKTIHYENKGHTIAGGDAHNDPIDDYGYGRIATDNYVQGMQGEDVRYEIHIRNTSPISLYEWTVIDRLPYIGDIGLVSGYERSSAFNVKMDTIEKVQVIRRDDDFSEESYLCIEEKEGVNGGNLEDITDYQVSYSSDKTSVLTEHSADWIRGQAGELQWVTARKDDAVNFRIAFGESVVINPNDEIVITFTGTVPNYVDKTGVDNIAWNSFAYAYQAPEILGNTVMVAEPAKVGVWVETPETANKITINKTSDKDGTFYFALFDKPYVSKPGETNANRLSDIISVNVKAGETAQVSMDNVDFKALTNNGNSVYLLETDPKGKVLTGYDLSYSAGEGTPVEKATDGNAGPEVTFEEGNNEFVANFDNKSHMGSIGFQKHLYRDEAGKWVKDTFYYALFTVDMGESNNHDMTEHFVRYEQMPVMKVTVDPETLEVSATCGGEPLIMPDGEELTATLVDEYVNKYNEVVPEHIEVKRLWFPPTVPIGEKYIVLETDENGKLKDNVAVYDEHATTTEADGDSLENPYYTLLDKYESVSGVNYTVSYGAGKKDPSEPMTDIDKYQRLISPEVNKDIVINNNKVVNYEIKVNKILDVADEDVLSKALGKFKVGLFDNENGTGEPLQTIDVIADEEASFKLTQDGTYYVFELDDEGNAITDSTTPNTWKLTDKQGKTFKNSDDSDRTFKLFTLYNGAGKTPIVLDNKNPDTSVNITNSEKNPNEINVTKSFIKDDGTEMTGERTVNIGLFTLNFTEETDAETQEKVKKYADSTKAENYTLVEGKTLKLTTDENGKGQVKFENLADGTYYVFEIDENNSPVLNGGVISIDDDKFISSYDTTMATLDSSAPASISIQNINEDKPSLMFAKYDANGNAFSGAELTITAENDLSGLEISDESAVVDGKTIKWTTSQEPLMIKGLAAGKYTLSETPAKGFAELADVEFEIGDDKYIIPQNSDSSVVSVSSTGISVTNLSEISISKVEIGKSDEIKDAVITITRTNTADSEGNKIEGSVTALNSEFITSDNSTLKVNESSLTFTSQDEKTVINGLPDGFYTMKEDVAPAGFEDVESEWTFKIIGGKIELIEIGEEDASHLAQDKDDSNHLIVNDKRSSALIISKKDITGENEVKGAVLTITTKDGSAISELTASGAELTEITDSEDNVIGYSFVSNGEDVIIEGLTAGTYVLKETAENGKSFVAEDGNEYTVIDSALEFTVDESGNITDTNSEADVLDDADDSKTEGYYIVENNAITVCDAVKSTSAVEISKQDAVSGEEISGAELKINKIGDVSEDRTPVYTDKDGAEIETSVVTSWITPDAVVVTETEIVAGENPGETDTSYVTVTDSDGNAVKTVPTTAVELEDGVYELIEETAPDGYKVAEKIYFAVKNGNVIYSGNDKPESEMTGEFEKVTMLDQPSKVTVNKADITGNTEVTGAELTLTYKGDGDISKVILKTGENTLVSGTDYTVDTAGKTISWTSKDKAVEIEYIPDGDYELKETGDKFTSADGKTYKVIDSTVSFTVEKGEIKSVTGTSVKDDKIPNSDGYVYYNADDETITDAKNTITVCDAEDTNKISISKQDAVTGKLIDGAKLIISKIGTVNSNADKVTVKDSEVTSKVAEYDTAYETVTSVVVDEEGNESTVAVTDENGEVVTTIADKEFELTDGVYELTEISAPEGYQVAETIYFIVMDGKVIYSDTVKPTEITAEDMGNKVVMKDQPNSAVISKQDASNGGTELAGAVISITAPENADLAHVYLKRGDTYLENGTDYTVDGNKITFTSGDEKTVIYSLVADNYKLTEDTAPLGYTKATEIDFTINEKGIVEAGDVIV